MGAFFGSKSSIKPMDFDLTSYENIFLGVQIWAGKTPPAVNKYLNKARFKDKKIWLFVTKSDEKVPRKYIESISRRIEKKGGEVVSNISITTRWNPENNIPISTSEVEERIFVWLTRSGIIENK